MGSDKPKFRFPTPFWGSHELTMAPFYPEWKTEMLVPDPRTVLERNLDRFTAAIRDKPRWWEKVFQSEVVQRWESEALEQDVDSKTFKFALLGVFESDEGLGEDLRQQLLAALQPLRDVPDGHKDWHPGSEQQVLDLVHPSLYPLVYGLSRCADGADEAEADPPAADDSGVAAAPAPDVPSVTGEAALSVAPAPVSPGPSVSPHTPDGEAGGGGKAVNKQGACNGNVDSAVANPSIAAGDEQGGSGLGADAPAKQPDAQAATAEATTPDPEGTQQQETPPADDSNAALVNRMVSAAKSWFSPYFGEWKSQMGAGEVINADVTPQRDGFASAKFQWLPADVLVGADGRVVFDSYVNNMHPVRHAPLYAATARLLERMLPLLERTLAASTQRPQRVYVVPRNNDHWWAPACQDEFWAALKASGEAAALVRRWRAVRAGLEPPAEDAAAGHALHAPGEAPAATPADAICTDEPAGLVSAVAKPSAAEQAGGCAGEAGEETGATRIGKGVDVSADDELVQKDWRNEIDRLYRERRVWVGPTLPERFELLPPPQHISLRSQVLQVIVKYAEIVLTPERPEYGGGAWHVEGMRNEAIVASCIAYLSADNISESRLHFRTMVADPKYEQDDNEGVRQMYGMENEGPMNEALGSVLCAQGRMLCWPNAFQHRVAPFRLADASRPGRRTFVSVFLVHPGEAVTSTRDVPPQQLEWHDEASQLGSLVPPEVKRKVDELREFPISLERAKELRLELMAERGRVVGSVNEEVFERQFSLCEH